MKIILDLPDETIRLPEPPDFNNDLRIINDLFTNGKFTKGIMHAGNTIRGHFETSTVAQRLEFINNVQKILPQGRDESVAFDNLRRAAGIENIDSRADLEKISEAILLALSMGLARIVPPKKKN